MEWAVPQFTRGEVDWAGRTIVKILKAEPGTFDMDEWYHALGIINNWRSAHAYPLNTFAVGLRAKGRKVDSSAVIAQRTKRLWSIWHKLDRFPTMQLCQMQDIGGCRAILSSTDQVTQLVQDYKRSSLRHKQRRMTDYISSPRSSGYRGVHIIWDYYSDKSAKKDSNSLKIEMQIRSSLQHAWATTVETIGTLTQQALKSSLGDKSWLRFFALMGAAMALRENTPCVPNTPENPDELVEELRLVAAQINASARLHTIGNALQTLEQPSAIERNAHFFLLELSLDSLKVTGFRANQQKEAQDQYIEVEQKIAKLDNSDAVLVSVDSVASLRRAYPNYFMDTQVFAGVLDDALGGNLLV